MNFKIQAMELRNHGFKVFPLHGISRFKGAICTCGDETCIKSAGKHPRIKNFAAAAKNASDEEIAAWQSQYPGSNIGISTEDLIVIDIDEAEGELAREILPLLPSTLSARTGRVGGMHRYYMPSVPHTLTVHALGGVDIRARGGYVVAPPSLHKSGAVYEWVNPEDGMAVLPEDIIKFLVAKTKIRKPIVVTESESGGDLVPPGQRHDYLRREIFKRVVTGRMCREEVEAVVEKYLLTQVEDGEDMAEHEVSRLIDGAFQRRNIFRLNDMTETGVSEKFIEYWKDDLVRLESGEWFQQQGGIWVPLVSPETLFKPVRQTVFEVNLEHEKTKDEPDTTYIHKFYSTSGSWKFAESVIKFSKTALTKPVNDFVPPDDTLPFENGLFDMVTGEFRGFKSSDNIMATMNAKFDPEATCPKWEETIKYVTGGDPEIIRYHQQVFGYLCSTRTMRGVFFLVGAKSTGKTTLITCLAEILGDRHAGTAQLGLIHHTKSFSEDEDMARTAVALVGKRFVFMDETKKDAVIDPAKFKRIASRDAVLTARHLRQDAFSFTNKAKVVILTNNQPNIDVDDDAAWDRVMYLPFLVSIAKEDRREAFKDELMAEASGILNWCIAGFQDYEANGFVQPEKVAEQIQDWQTEDNPVAQFIDECCMVIDGVRSNASALWEKYEGWREIAGYGKDEGRMKSASMFGKSIVRLMGDKVQSTKSNGKRNLQGIALKG